VRNYGVREISFWDDTMTYNKKWMSEFCERLIAAKLDVIWSCYAAMRTIDQPVLGIVCIAAFVLGIALLLNREIRTPQDRHRWMVLMALFIFSFFIAWSPIDFWRFLPKAFWFVQYPYRFLTYPTLFGALMLALVVTHYWPERSPVPGVIALIILGLLLTAIPWIQIAEKQTPIDLESHLANPAMINGSHAYLYRPRSYGWKIEPEEPVPANEILRPVAETQKVFHVLHGGFVQGDLHMDSDGFAQLPVLNYPLLLRVEINGTRVPYRSSIFWDGKYIGVYPLLYRLTTVRLKSGDNHIVVKFTGLPAANAASAVGWILTLALFCLSWLRRERPDTERARF